MKAFCLVCGKQCHPTADRNADGTHAHRECLYMLSSRPGEKTEAVK